MPLGKKWRSMDVLNFGSSKHDKDSLRKSNPFLGSRENLSKSARNRCSSRDSVLDHNHNEGSTHNLDRDNRSRLGSLSNVKEKDDASAKQDEGGGGWDKEGYIQRCVIIQRDERGYGLTVRGDNPVYVESVKPDGAAARAGVQQGDRICKVNGTLVTNSNHIEVVKLIKSGSFVALTLMNKVQGTSPTDRPPGDGPPSGVPLRDRVTAPIPVDERKSVELNYSKYNELKKYLDIAVEDLNIARQRYQKDPSDKLQSVIQSKEKTVKKLEEQLKEQSTSPPPHHHGDTKSNSVHIDTPVPVAPWGSVPNQVSDGSSSTDSPSTSPNTSPTPTHPGNTEEEDGTSRKRDSGYIDDTTQAPQTAKPHQEIIAMDEDEFSDEDQSNTSSDYGPFNDLKSLDNRPAHMAVFLNFTLQNESPSSLLFYITSNIYQQAKGGCKELQKWAFEIHSTFLVSGAPLKISEVTDAVISEIDNILVNKNDKEEALRSIFLQARNIVHHVVDKHLEEFRSKRDIGFWSMYGAQHLKDNMKSKEEMEVVHQVLSKHLENVQSETEDAKPDRNLAIAWALATFIRSVGQSDKRHNSSLDRVQSFIAKDKKSISMKLASQNKKKVTKDHQFCLQHYVRVEYCIYCRKPLWGVGYQGYQCQSCEQSVHKQCIDKLEEWCPKKKRRPPSGIIQGRPKVPTVNEDASSPGPTSIGNSFVIQNLSDPPDEDATKGHSVSSMISRFDPSKSGQNDRKKSPSAEESQRKGAEIGRSESLKGRHDRGGRPTRRAKRYFSDIDKDESLMQVLNPSGSSSNSSIRSGESPSNSMDAVNNIPQAIDNDSDFDIEAELPPLDSIFPKDVYKKMKPKEKKRQEVINELFYTEKSHVKNLKILLNMFYKPMLLDSNYNDLVRILFPNLEEMVTLHGALNNMMKSRRRENPVVSEVGDLLLKRFDGEEGEVFRAGCAKYCRNQSYALDFLRARQRKDSRLANFLNEAESSPLMKKLQLKDFIPKQMMRLTKYPLLIESLLRYTQTSTEEHSRLEKALRCSKHILEFVNTAVKDFENHYTLEQLQRKIDKRQIDTENEELKSLVLPHHKLVYEGNLTWNINQKKTVDVHVVLLEDLLVLLQKADDKYLLKYQSTQLVAGKDESRFMFSPILNLKNVLHTNQKATDKKTFFVVSKSQIYELSAHTADEQRKWIKYIKESSDSFKRADKVVEEQPAMPETISEKKSQLHGIHRPGADDLAHPDVSIVTQGRELIQPNELTISGVMTVKSEPVLQPLEKMKRLDEGIKESMQEKKLLLAQVLDIPASEIPHRVQMTVDHGPESSASDLLLALAHESGDCITTLNAAESGLAEEDLKMPIPMEKLREMANRMNQILTNLLEKTRQYAALTASPSPNTSAAVVSSRDEERERLRLELKAAQDELNYLRDIQRRVISTSPTSATTKDGRPQSMISEASSYSDTETEPRIIPDEEGQEETSDVNEDLETTRPEADEEEYDSEYSEPEMSSPTELPTGLSNIPKETEVSPPEGEVMTEVDPPCLSHDDLVRPDNVQEAEINHINDLPEQVSEIEVQNESNSECEGQGVTENESKTDDRGENDPELQNESGDVKTDVECQNQKEDDNSVDDLQKTENTESIEDEGTPVDLGSKIEEDAVSKDVNLEEANVNVTEEKSDSESEKLQKDQSSEGDSAESRTKDQCPESESIDSSKTSVDSKLIDADSNENVIDPTNNDAEAMDNI